MFGLSKLADKDFVVGFVLPVLLFTAAVTFLFRDTAAVGSIYKALLDQKSFTGLTMLVLAIWTVATLLLAWDTSIYRLLEGYAGPFKSKKWRAAMEAKFLERKHQLAIIHDQIAGSNDDGKAGAPSADDRERNYLRQYEEFRTLFPFRRDLVLPTRFGNVVRAFESYALNVYGVDAIPAWTRLAGVIPGPYSTLINAARSEVNFFVNVWALSIAFAILSAGRLAFELVCRVVQSEQTAVHWTSAISILIGAGVAIGAYESAIDRAKSWGETVKGAFDLYLAPLANQLGYAIPPTREGERGRLAFWEAITGMLLLQQPIEPEDWPAARPPVGQIEHPNENREAVDTNANEDVTD